MLSALPVQDASMSQTLYDIPVTRIDGQPTTL
ncbi:glutathione peroxidase, partial [Xanthomonas perforans]